MPSLRARIAARQADRNAQPHPHFSAPAASSGSPGVCTARARALPRPHLANYGYEPDYGYQQPGYAYDPYCD